MRSTTKERTWLVGASPEEVAVVIGIDSGRMAKFAETAEDMVGKPFMTFDAQDWDYVLTLLIGVGAFYRIEASMVGHGCETVDELNEMVRNGRVGEEEREILREAAVDLKAGVRVWEAMGKPLDVPHQLPPDDDTRRIVLRDGSAILVDIDDEHSDDEFRAALEDKS